jgi:hypothetical protein
MCPDPFFCDGCDMDVSHDGIETVPDVPRVSLDRFESSEQSADVYRSGDCGILIGVIPSRPPDRNPVMTGVSRLAVCDAVHAPVRSASSSASNASISGLSNVEEPR